MMRLRRLDLEFFGRFSGKSFDFGARRDADTPDFHVIYGLNEAGKTTTMEGYLRLLYGFPHREPYDFLHQRKNLRVSGLLDIDGAETSFTRMPTRDPSLRDAEGRELPNSALQAHLGGLSEDDYRNLLCLDDLTIEKGGEEITKAKGDIGRLLFSAAAGISELSAVLDTVREQADTLYRKRASTTRLAALKKELADVEGQIRDLDISAAQYRSLKKALGEALQEETEVSGRRKELFALKAQLEAKLQALPILHEIDELDDKLADFENWPTHLNVDSEDLVQMLADQTKATGDITKFKEELESLRAELGVIKHHPEHVALAQALEDLDPLRSKYAAAQLDLDRRRKNRDQVLVDMGIAVRDMGITEDIDPKALVLPAATLSELEQARDRMRDADAAVRHEQDEVATLNDKVRFAKTQLAELNDGTSASADLADLFERFDIDTLSARYAAASEALKTARGARHVAFDALTLKGQSFEALPVSPLTAEEAEAQHSELQITVQKIRAAEEDVKSIEATVEERAARIAVIKDSDGLVDDAEARHLRTERDAFWQAHRASLSAATADAFEGAMARVDTVTDLRLSKAADLGTLRQQEQDLASDQAKLETAAQKVAILTRARDTILERMAGAARDAGIKTSITPDAFCSWLRKLDLARQAQDTLRRLEAEHQDTFQKADRLTQALAAHFNRDTPEFEELVGAAKASLTAQRSHQERLRSASSRLNDLTQDHQRRTDKLSALEDVATTARGDWLALIKHVLPDIIDVHALENALKPLQDLRELDTQRGLLERQISSMEEDQAQFSEGVEALIARLGTTTVGEPMVDYAEMKALVHSAAAAEKKAEDLTKRIEAHEASLAAAQKILDDINRMVAEFARAFPDGVDTGSLTALRQAVKTASDVIDSRSKRQEQQRKVATLLDLKNTEEARSFLAGATQAGLQAQLDEVIADLEGIETRYKAAIETRSAAEQQLRSIGGDADVALLVERKATIEIEMQETALRHLELSLGHRLAETAIRRYRDVHRSTMMQATETAFAELTNGAYSTLQTQADGTSETLLAIDAAGMAKQAHDMSKGTRFQLYLALRAAAYEQLADQGAALPFFCDDIFETFDEERTRSACRVMERIGRRGQAIYLTHHQHVVDIARDVCGEGLQIHQVA